MPWAILTIGTMILVTAYQGTEDAFFTQVKQDMLGSNGMKSGFVFWFLAIAVVGGLGYIPSFRPLSRAFLVLLLVVLFLAQSKNGGGGFFQKFQQQLQTMNTSPTTNPANPAGVSFASLPTLPPLPTLG